MSRALYGYEYGNNEFELGDRVSFLHAGERLVGTVVRVYNTRLFYHVEVDGRRYEVEIPDDDMRREKDDGPLGLHPLIALEQATESG